MRKYVYRHALTQEVVEVGPDEKEEHDRNPMWRRVWHAAPVHFNADGFTKTHDDPTGKFQAERRRKRSKARRDGLVSE